MTFLKEDKVFKVFFYIYNYKVFDYRTFSKPLISFLICSLNHFFPFYLFPPFISAVHPSTRAMIDHGIGQPLL